MQTIWSNTAGDWELWSQHNWEFKVVSDILDFLWGGGIWWNYSHFVHWWHPSPTQTQTIAEDLQAPHNWGTWAEWIQASQQPFWGITSLHPAAPKSFTDLAKKFSWPTLEHISATSISEMCSKIKCQKRTIKKLKM